MSGEQAKSHPTAAPRERRKAETERKHNPSKHNKLHQLMTATWNPSNYENHHNNNKHGPHTKEWNKTIRTQLVTYPHHRNRIKRRFKVREELKARSWRRPTTHNDHRSEEKQDFAAEISAISEEEEEEARFCSTARPRSRPAAGAGVGIGNLQGTFLLLPTGYVGRYLPRGFTHVVLDSIFDPGWAVGENSVRCSCGQDGQWSDWSKRVSWSGHVARPVRANAIAFPWARFWHFWFLGWGALVPLLFSKIKYTR